MSQALFRIGGVYRDNHGTLVELRPCLIGGFAAAHIVGVDGVDLTSSGLSRLLDGRDRVYLDVDDHKLHLIPGELHQVDGQWVAVEEKRSFALKPVIAPIPEDMVAPDDGWLDDWMSDAANAAMIARDGPAKKCHWDGCPHGEDCVHAKPIPEEPKSTALPAVAGLMVVGQRDHRFGLSSTKHI
jgi:hypothetical protein